MYPDQLLKEYGNTVGLPDLAFDAGNSLVLTIGSEVEIYVQADPENGGLILHTEVGQPHSPGPNLFKQLLQANLFHSGAGSPVTALGPSGEVIVLLGLTPAELELENFVRALEQLLEEAAHWRPLILDPHGEKEITENPSVVQGVSPFLMA